MPDINTLPEPAGYEQYAPGEIVGGAAAENSPTGTTSTIKPSDKQKTEELASMLPKTWIDLILASTLWQNMDANLGLGGIANNSRKDCIGVTEGSILLTVLQNWVNNVEQENVENQKEADDPLLIALRNYLHKGPGEMVTVDSFELLRVLRSSPLLLSALRTMDQNMLAKVYALAEQKLIISLLDMWGKAAEKNAEMRKQSSIRHDILQHELNMRILQDYVKDVANKEQALSQTVVSILVSGMFQDQAVQVPMKIDMQTGAVTLDLAKESLMPVGNSVVSDLINSFSQVFPEALKASLSAVSRDIAHIMASTTSTAAYMSIPGAVTLAAAETHVEGSYIPKSAARAYAQTIAEFILDPHFDAFVMSRILKHVDLKTVPKEKLSEFVTTMKATLLANALAALDKIHTGGAVIRGADIRDLLNGTTKVEEGDFRYTLVKLINEQLNLLPERTKESVRSSMIRYFDTNPDLSTMLDPAEAFLALSDMSVDQKTTGSHSV